MPVASKKSPKSNGPLNRVKSTLSGDYKSMKAYAENIAAGATDWDNIKSSSINFMDDMASNGSGLMSGKAAAGGRLAGYGLVAAAGLDLLNPFGLGWND